MGWKVPRMQPKDAAERVKLIGDVIVKAKAFLAENLSARKRDGRNLLARHPRSLCWRSRARSDNSSNRRRNCWPTIRRLIDVTFLHEPNEQPRRISTRAKQRHPRRRQQSGAGLRRRRRPADLHRPRRRGVPLRHRRQSLPRLHRLVGPADPGPCASARRRGGDRGGAQWQQLRRADRARDRTGRTDSRGDAVDRDGPHGLVRAPKRR